MNILNTFIDNTTVETKVLGLVNNIAEVPHLRKMLFSNDIIPTLRYCSRFNLFCTSIKYIGAITYILFNINYLFQTFVAVRTN